MSLSFAPAEAGFPTEIAFTFKPFYNIAEGWVIVLELDLELKVVCGCCSAAVVTPVAIAVAAAAATVVGTCGVL